MEQNIVLSNQTRALAAEIESVRQENTRLAGEKEVLMQNQRKEIQPLGRKHITDLGPDAISKTKASIKSTFFNDINVYGKNRGIEVEKLVLRDAETGKRLEVNAERSHTYENLLPDEKRRVKAASRWKDRTRSSDETYSSLNEVGEFPAASHVKSYEKEVNSMIGEVLPVGLIC